MFCTRCGTRLTDGARFCTVCGLAVGAPAILGAPVIERSAQRPLHRDMAHKKLAGVCAGFAEYFDVDITLMRLIWLALFFLPPSIGGIAYIVAWAVMPKG